VGACGIDGDEIADLDAAPFCGISANDVIDVSGVDIAPRVSFILIRIVDVGGLRDVIAGEWIVWALRNGPIVLVNEITDDLLVCAIEVMGVHKVVECGFSRGAVRVGGSVYIDVHAAGEEFEGRMLAIVLGKRNCGYAAKISEGKDGK
jgi:hypothetical protein